ncbi:guanylate cyclase, putative [Bodo saltans]|uniref:Guanylate cyclase, putative n=1 Tax=Bodo saltans TaxID=75058 RepID=A0A0S4JHN8_BODSA|nr:guanylate cyclase, putative [Bodo saltans]|eukprot:CUG91007.1 guanylate cyclase, putative [Bodo saltans]
MSLNTLCTVSVRSVITLFCVVLIIVTAATTLGVTYSFSLSAAEEIAQAHAVALAAKAKGDVEAFVNQPAELISGLQYMMTRDSFPLPQVLEASGQTEWYRAWWQRMVTSMQGASFAYQYAIVGFNDGNYAGCKLLPTTVPAGLFQCRVFQYSYRAIVPGLSFVRDETYFISNYSMYSNDTTTTTYDPRTRSWWTATPHVPFTMTWSSVYLSAIPTLPVVDLNAALFNASGTFIGIGSFTFELGSVATFINSLQTTANTNVFLLDNANILMASSYAAVPYLSETVIPSNFSSANVPSNCVMSDVANGATQSLLFCRYNISSYPYAPLQQLYATAPAVLIANGTDGKAISMKLGGVSYYVSIAQISSPLTLGLHWRVVLLMPETDIIQGIIDGRNTAIYIAIGLLVGTSLIALGVVTALLSPLATLADRMYRAATFDDSVGAEGEGENLRESRFQEVKAIQEAFDTLMGELAKVKSYLPQSVLAALYGDDDDEEDGEADENLRGDESSSMSKGREETASNMMAGKQQPQLKREQSNSSLARAPNGSVAGLQRGGSTRSMALGKRRSLQSTVGGGGSSTAAPAALNTSLKLTQRKVTILAINVVRFHHLLLSTSSPSPADEVLKIHGAIVDLICRLAREHKGVVDSFNGDRFLITFNAVTNVGNHACAAANCALAISKAIHDANSGEHKTAAPGTSMHLLRQVSGVTCGIASSVALVGNTGTASMKRFCVIGPCVGHALVMERMCKMYNSNRSSTNGRGGHNGDSAMTSDEKKRWASPSSGHIVAGPPRVSVMICGQAIHDVESFFEMIHVNMLSLPIVPTSAGSSSSLITTRRTQIAILAGPKVVSCDEWMYQLEEGSWRRAPTRLATACTTKHSHALSPPEAWSESKQNSSHKRRTSAPWTAQRIRCCSRSVVRKVHDCWRSCSVWRHLAHRLLRHFYQPTLPMKSCRTSQTASQRNFPSDHLFPPVSLPPS